ncbi:COG7 [Candida theae]|uniref:COG7 n=1 Tax=Candida theae TaxID=1198502 RepID=A0AAD5G161_9ASCO|nr:COG7 [Candida theae]KAI5968446.1 COG7 [Candida theae]
MSSSNVEESMSMFFDDEFNPSTYIDKLVTSVTQQKSTTTPTTTTTTTHAPSSYSKQSLTKLSHTINQLITHFDYYVNDIANNSLHEKLEKLHKSSALIHTGTEIDQKNGGGSGGSSRLQYHLNILDNSILSLQSELEEINKSIESNESINNEAVQTLVQLKVVKQNLVTVIEVLEMVINSLSKVNESKSNYTVEEFQSILDELLSSVKSQLNTIGDKSILLAHIDKLVSLQDVFSSLNNFSPVYKRFTTKLITERDEHLKRSNT